MVKKKNIMGQEEKGQIKADATPLPGKKSNEMKKTRGTIKDKALASSSKNVPKRSPRNKVIEKKQASLQQGASLENTWSWERAFRKIEEEAQKAVVTPTQSPLSQDAAAKKAEEIKISLEKPVSKESSLVGGSPQTPSNVIPGFVMKTEKPMDSSLEVIAKQSVPKIEATQAKSVEPSLLKTQPSLIKNQMSSVGGGQPQGSVPPISPAKVPPVLNKPQGPAASNIAVKKEGKGIQKEDQKVLLKKAEPTVANPLPKAGPQEKPIREKKRGFKGKMLLIILAIILGGGFLISKFLAPKKIIEQHAALSQGKTQQKVEQGKGSVQVKAFKVARVRFEDSLGILGVIKGYRQVDLRFEANGVLDQFNYREGDFLKQGEVVATLKPTEALLRIAYNENKLESQVKREELAKEKLDKKQLFYEEGAIVKSEVVQAQLEYEATVAQVKLTKNELELAQNEFEKTKLRAPMDAFMGTREADPGEFITANTKIGSIFDIESVYAELGVIEKEIRKVKVGQVVKMVSDAYTGIEFNGIIDKMPSMVEGKSRTMPLKVKVDNTNHLLKPGMFVQARIFVFEKNDALIVPAMALIDSNGDSMFDSVFVIEYGESVKLQKIEVGYVTSDYAEITSGLEEGKEIVVETSGQLEDGTKVEITSVDQYGAAK